MLEALDACPPVLEYISVSKTITLTSSPEARTWSRPPKPMSYAQPSPPKIQTDFLAMNCLLFRISADFSQPAAAAFSSSAIRAFAGSSLALVLFLVSRNFSKAAFSSAEALSEPATSAISLIRFSRTVFWPMYRPRPCSALSSNRELHHAGPWPLSLLTVYGEMEAVPPQMEEQPVALEMYIFSPNS